MARGRARAALARVARGGPAERADRGGGRGDHRPRWVRRGRDAARHSLDRGAHHPAVHGGRRGRRQDRHRSRRGKEPGGRVLAAPYGGGGPAGSCDAPPARDAFGPRRGHQVRDDRALDPRTGPGQPPRTGGRRRSPARLGADRRVRAREGGHRGDGREGERPAPGAQPGTHARSRPRGGGGVPPFPARGSGGVGSSRGAASRPRPRPPLNRRGADLGGEDPDTRAAARPRGAAVGLDRAVRGPRQEAPGRPRRVGSPAAGRRGAGRRMRRRGGRGGLREAGVAPCRRAHSTPCSRDTPTSPASSRLEGGSGAQSRRNAQEPSGVFRGC